MRWLYFTHCKGENGVLEKSSDIEQPDTGLGTIQQ